MKLSRRAFVGLSAGVAFADGSVVEALAQGSGLGRPHPPIVAENDPRIESTWISIQLPDKAIRAYFAQPKDAGPQTPAVVIVMHVWGVDTSIRDVVRRFATEGFAALAPDLYDGLHAPSGDGATDFKPFADFAGKLVDSQVDGHLRACALWLKAHYPQAKVGVTGFCMGGSIALRQAIDNGDVFSAVAVWYGKVRYATGSAPGSSEGAITRMALAYSDEIRVPIAGNFGERDTSIRADDVRALQKQLTAPNDIKVYAEAGHAFFDDQRESYVASAAADAWSRTLSFFRKYLA